MARTQFTSYAKDRGYKQRNLPTDQILARQERRDNEIIANAQKNADAITDEGQRILNTIKDNNRVEASFRDSNKRLKDSYDANRRNAIVKRRDTEVAYYQDKSKSFVEQGKLLSGLAESAGEAAQKAFLANKQAADAKLLQEQVSFSAYKTELLEVAQRGVKGKDSIYIDRQTNRIVFDEDVYKSNFIGSSFVEDETGQSRQALESILNNDLDEQKALSEIETSLSKELKEQTEKYKKLLKEKKKDIQQYNTFYDFNQQQFEEFQELHPGYQLKKRNAKLLLAETSIHQYRENIHQELKLLNNENNLWTPEQLIRISGGITIKHYGLENVHTSAAVKIKKAIIKNSQRMHTTHLQEVHKVRLSQRRIDVKDQIGAAGNNYKELNSILGQMHGASTLYTTRQGEKFTHQKDALFGSPDSLLSVIYKKHGKEAAHAFVDYQGEDGTEKSWADRYDNELLEELDNLEKLKIKQNQQINSAKDQKAIIDDFARFKKNLTESSGDPKNPSLYDKIEIAKQEGTLHAISNELAAELNTKVHPENRVKAEALIYQKTNLYRFASAETQADDAAKDYDYGAILDILDNANINNEVKNRIRSKYGTILNRVNWKDLKKPGSYHYKEIKNMLVTGSLGVADPDSIKQDHPTLGDTMREARNDYANIVASLVRDGQTGNIESAALGLLRKKIEDGKNNPNSRYYVIPAGIFGLRRARFGNAFSADDPGYKSPQKVISLFSKSGNIRDIIRSNPINSKLDLNDMLANFDLSRTLGKDWRMELTAEMEENFQIANRFLKIRDGEKPLTRGEFLALSIEASGGEEFLKAHNLNKEFLDKLRNADTESTILRASDIANRITARIPNIKTKVDYIKMCAATSAINNGMEDKVLNAESRAFMDTGSIEGLYKSIFNIEGTGEVGDSLLNDKIISDSFDPEQRPDIFSTYDTDFDSWLGSDDGRRYATTFTYDSLDQPILGGFKHCLNFDLNK